MSIITTNSRRFIFGIAGLALSIWAIMMFLDPSYRPRSAISVSPSTTLISESSQDHAPSSTNSRSVSTSHINSSLKRYSIDLENCQPRSNGDGEIIVQDCATISGYQFFVVARQREPRSWLHIQKGAKGWTTEKTIVYEPENQFGDFPNVAGMAVLITDTNSNAPVGLIVPVVSQVPGSFDRFETQYFTFSFSAKGPCFVGRSSEAKNAEERLSRTDQCQLLEPAVLKIERGL